jgi:protein Hikeshi
MNSISPTQFAISFPAAPTFHNVGVFLHPGSPLPTDTAAGVYMKLPQDSEFKFLGAIANEKPSALFRVNLSEGATGDVNLGISVEPIHNISAQMAQLQSQQRPSSAAQTTARKPPDTKLLAQRIIKNAFNFLASFAGNTANGIEVVPLKSFQDWWGKFERRIQNDPSFLERDED